MPISRQHLEIQLYSYIEIANKLFMALNTVRYQSGGVRGSRAGLTEELPEVEERWPPCEPGEANEWSSSQTRLLITTRRLIRRINLDCHIAGAKSV
jgi:hypothetical protein